MSKRKIGIVGAGNVASSSYLPYLVSRGDLDIIIQSRTFSKAQEVAKKFSCRAVETLEELAAESPETVLVLTSEMAHIDVAESLLNLGIKRMFIEKPLNARKGQANVSEDDYTEAAAFLKHAESLNCQVAMNFNYRFYDVSQKIRQIVAERGYGQLKQSSWYVHYACWSHCIDLLHCFGGAIRTVSALGIDKPNGDLAGAFILENGGTGVILGTEASDFKTPLYHVVLNFEKATITFADLDSELRVFCKDTDYVESYNLVGDKSRWDKYNGSFARSVEAYLAAIAAGKEPPVTGADGLRELQFEAALRRSVKRQVPVCLKEL